MPVGFSGASPAFFIPDNIYRSFGAGTLRLAEEMLK
jgi:hypothetical protein